MGILWRTEDRTQELSRKTFLLMLGCIVLFHLFYTTLFVSRHNLSMTVMHMAGTILCIFVFFLMEVDKRGKTVLFLASDVFFQGVMGTFICGWESGFSIFLVCMIPVFFYIPYRHKWLAWVQAVMTAGAFLALKIHADSGRTVLAFKERENESLYLFNAGFSFVILIIVSTGYHRRMKETQKELAYMAERDPLTGLLNRRRMYDAVKKELSCELASGRRNLFSIAICDVDNFKEINDTYGHNCGDYVLRKIANIMEKAVGKDEILCRWGGEEFLILLHDGSYESSILRIERLRRQIEEESYVYKGMDLSITLTFGVCSNEEMAGYKEMLQEADRRLYQGKKNGKNQVISA